MADWAKLEAALFGTNEATAPTIAEPTGVTVNDPATPGLVPAQSADPLMDLMKSLLGMSSESTVDVSLPPDPTSAPVVSGEVDLFDPRELVPGYGTVLAPIEETPLIANLAAARRVEYLRNIVEDELTKRRFLPGRQQRDIAEAISELMSLGYVTLKDKGDYGTQLRVVPVT
jgi:hypothetical protein